MRTFTVRRELCLDGVLRNSVWPRVKRIRGPDAVALEKTRPATRRAGKGENPPCRVWCNSSIAEGYICYILRAIFVCSHPFGRVTLWVEIKNPAGVSARMVLEKPTAPPARSHNTNFFSAKAARP